MRAKKKPLHTLSGIVYQLKITLCDSDPPIWRRICVPAECSLEHLHYAIQDAMGWENDHLRAFDIDGQEYMGRSPMGDEMDSDGLDALQYRLCDVAQGEKAQFKYRYDFGDDWDHVMLIEKILPRAPDAESKSSKLFTCLAGEGACPPEDCGGIWRYYDVLKILHNPKHSSHEEMKEWHGGVTDPNAFDLAAANKRMSCIRIK